MASGNVNSSVNHMDQMTQQNAAMVEETTVASQVLQTRRANCRISSIVSV